MNCLESIKTYFGLGKPLEWTIGPTVEIPPIPLSKEDTPYLSEHLYYERLLNSQVDIPYMPNFEA
jgi:hypothetical protein